MLPDTLETDRLRLERLSRENVDPFEWHDACSGPDMADVTEHMPWSAHETVKESFDHLRDQEAAWDDREDLYYAVRPREGEDGAGEIAGAAKLDLDWDTRSAEFGFWLQKRFWGRGYSGERADAMFDLAFDTLDLELVRTGHLVGNEKSRSAVRTYVDRHGGQRDGVIRNHVPMEGEIRDQVVYTVTQDQWRDSR